MSAGWIVPLDDPTAADPALVGGKGAGLQRLLALGIRVPAGFVVSTAAFTTALDEFTQARIEAPLRALPADAAPARVEEAAAAARAAVLDAVADDPVLDAVRAAYSERGLEAVAVRSSAAAEDAADCLLRRRARHLPGVRGPDDVRGRGAPVLGQPVHRVVRSSYRGERDAGAMAVVVQQMVPARAAGVFMTLNPANGDRSTLVCEAVWGLGEPLVSGAVTPDRFVARQGQRRRRAPRDRRQADRGWSAHRRPAGTVADDVAGERRERPVA